MKDIIILIYNTDKKYTKEMIFYEHFKLFMINFRIETLVGINLIMNM